jgi:hypothetical protein
MPLVFLLRSQLKANKFALSDRSVTIHVSTNFAVSQGHHDNTPAALEDKS